MVVGQAFELALGSPLAACAATGGSELYAQDGAAALLRAALLCFQAMECARLACWYFSRPSVLRALRGCRLAARFVF